MCVCVDTKRVLKVPSCVLCTHMFAAHSAWRHVKQKELRIDAFLDMPQAGELGSGGKGRRGGAAWQLRNIACILLQLLLRIRHVARAAEAAQPVARYKSLDNNSPGPAKQNKRRKGIPRRAGGGGEQGGKQEGGSNAACGKARQVEAIKAQDLKYFPSGGPFGPTLAHPCRVSPPSPPTPSSSLLPCRLSAIRILFLFLFARCAARAHTHTDADTQQGAWQHAVSVLLCLYVCVCVCVCDLTCS